MKIKNLFHSFSTNLSSYHQFFDLKKSELLKASYLKSRNLATLVK
jgi:hypothetical protein